MALSIVPVPARFDPESDGPLGAFDVAGGCVCGRHDRCVDLDVRNLPISLRICEAGSLDLGSEHLTEARSIAVLVELDRCVDQRRPIALSKHHDDPPRDLVKILPEVTVSD